MSRRPDEAHRVTDEELEKLERRIARVYREARDELDDTINAYFQAFEARDAEMKSMVESGEITEEHYKQWRLNQIGRGERFEALRDKIAERYTEANETAVSYVNDETPGIYSLNRNYSAYTIDRATGGALTIGPDGEFVNADFILFDESTVRRLIVEEPDIMPYYPPERAVRRGIDLAYGKSQITKTVTSGILQGLGVGQIADRLQDRIETMSRTSALRAARTGITAAQNAGRLDSYHAAQEMGIKLKKQWLATLDARTRHSHQSLDGEIQEVGKPFSNGCMLPGDPRGRPSETYNCRCTLISDLTDEELGTAQRRARDPVTGKTVVIDFTTWPKWMESVREAHGDEAVDAALKKIRNRSNDKKQHAKYRRILGKDVPRSFEIFQNLKYNSPEKWERIKTLKRQTVFVNNALCETTPKKYTHYFLDPEKKHAVDFLGVGYTRENPMRLRYDMARQFDMKKAVDRKVDKNGVETFNIYMNLGVTETKSFLTAWRIDNPGDKPRIITGFRKGPKAGKDDKRDS